MDNAANGGSAIASASSVLIANNVIAGNHGGESVIAGVPQLVANNTIVDNQGTAVDVGSCAVYNNILAFNGSSIRGGADIANNCVYGNADEAGAVHGRDCVLEEPMLADRAAGDYHLAAGSPCINAGDSHYQGLPATDAEGRPRLLCGAVDIGVYEVPDLPPPLTDLTVVKKSPRHTWVLLAGQAVTAAFGGPFYIESATRACGIRVEHAPCSVEAGMEVDVEGVVHTNEYGECCIEAIAATPRPGAAVGPLGLSCADLGGGAFGLQAATWQAKRPDPDELLEWRADAGLSNIGLLVRIWGRITHVDSYGNCYIDDGSARRDGTQYYMWDGGDFRVLDNVGVLVQLSTAGLQEGQMLNVTGVVSCLKLSGKVVPVLIATDARVVAN